MEKETIKYGESKWRCVIILVLVRRPLAIPVKCFMAEIQIITCLSSNYFMVY